jgi:hypothetical protein
VERPIRLTFSPSVHPLAPCMELLIVVFTLVKAFIHVVRCGMTFCAIFALFADKQHGLFASVFVQVAVHTIGCRSVPPCMLSALRNWMGRSRDEGDAVALD